MGGAMNCRICAHDIEPFARSTLLGRFEIGYYRCTHCGFIRTEEPYWLSEAYSSAITASDVGLVQRNNQLAAITMVVISAFFRRGGRFLDYAGGYGLFVRLMRDSGYDFRWYDRYCENIFARGFEVSSSDMGPLEMQTAFEVFEHLADPAEELEQMLTRSKSILFTTQLLPEPHPRPGEWWYYGLEHGQHIAFYTRRSLAILAERSGLNFYTNGTSMHLFTGKRLCQPLFSALARFKTARFPAPLVKRKSLIPADYARATGSSLDREV